MNQSLSRAVVRYVSHLCQRPSTTRNKDINGTNYNWVKQFLSFNTLETKDVVIYKKLTESILFIKRTISWRECFVYFRHFGFKAQSLKWTQHAEVERNHENYDNKCAWREKQKSCIWELDRNKRRLSHIFTIWRHDSIHDVIYFSPLNFLFIWEDESYKLVIHFCCWLIRLSYYFSMRLLFI